MKKVGIFSGVFDPVHKGHIAFALAAIKEAKLDRVYFLVEAKPRRKTEVTHVAHRIALARLATSPHNQLEVLELPDARFSVAKTLPRLKQKFPKDGLFLLMGSDMLEHLPDWPLVDRLLEETELVVGLRQTTDLPTTRRLIANLSIKPTKIHLMKSPEPNISSGQIRQALLGGKKTTGLLPSTTAYVKKHWLYASPSNTNSSS